VEAAEAPLELEPRQRANADVQPLHRTRISSDT
jgi:hypothetical protein